jgi:hypothetical protein
MEDLRTFEAGAILAPLNFTSGNYVGEEILGKNRHLFLGKYFYKMTIRRPRGGGGGFSFCIDGDN